MVLVTHVVEVDALVVQLVATAVSVVTLKVAIQLMHEILHHLNSSIVIV
jgi:hypothetical protein